MLGEVFDELVLRQTEARRLCALLFSVLEDLVNSDPDAFSEDSLELFSDVGGEGFVFGAFVFIVTKSRDYQIEINIDRTFSVESGMERWTHDLNTEASDVENIATIVSALCKDQNEERFPQKLAKIIKKQIDQRVRAENSPDTTPEPL